MSHDQNFKKLILNDPRGAIHFAAAIGQRDRVGRAQRNPSISASALALPGSLTSRDFEDVLLRCATRDDQDFLG